MEQGIVGYVCGVDWQHELNETICWIYKDLEDFKKNQECWICDGIVKFSVANPECLIDKGNYWLHDNKVKAQVKLIEWVHKQDRELMFEMAVSPEEYERNRTNRNSK